MSDPSKESIRIGTLVRGGPEPEVARYIGQILPHGFESIGLIFRRSLEGLSLGTLAKEVNKILEGEGVKVSSLGMFCNPLMEKEAARDIRRCIDKANLFGCNLVTGFAGRLKDVPIDQNMKAFKKVWTPLAKRAEDKGVRIAFENCDMGGTWERGEHNIAHSPDAWEMMFHEIPMENLGLEWEPCHQMVSLIDPIPQLKKWVSKIFHLHGKDATIHWDVIREHGIHGPKTFAFHRTPGFGDSNWTDIISILRASGFKGSIDIEGWHDPVYRGDLEMTGQVRALRYLKECRGGDFVPNPS
jgi:sugar phosphate isomerase/epimerase